MRFYWEKKVAVECTKRRSLGTEGSGQSPTACEQLDRPGGVVKGNASRRCELRFLEWKRRGGKAGERRSAGELLS